MRCPKCGPDEKLIKAGMRNTSKGRVQKYHCKNCGKYFSDTGSPGTQYPERVILYALEMFNRGYSVKGARKLAGRRFHTSIPGSTIYTWIHRYKGTLPFLKLRKRYEIEPKSLLTVKRLDHGVVYPFKYHDLKLNIHSKTRPELRRYIGWMERSLDHSMFMKGPRASNMHTDQKAGVKKVDSDLPKLARMAIDNGPKNTKTSPHEIVEEFLLVNDSSTVAVELPVFLYPKETPLDIEEPLTGHIDIIQIRYGNVHVLDYKPNLNHPENHIDQLTIYKDALQKRTSIPRSRIKIGVFNEHSHYDLIPE